MRLEAVVNHKNQNADRDAERASDHRDQIDREKVDAVHQRDPDEDGQRERSNIGTIAMNQSLGLIIHKFHQHFDGTLELAGDAGSSLVSRLVKQPQG